MSANRSLSETNTQSSRSTTQTLSLEFFHESSVLHLSTVGNFIPEIVKQRSVPPAPIRFLVGRFAALPRRYHVKNTRCINIFTLLEWNFFWHRHLTDPEGLFNIFTISTLNLSQIWITQANYLMISSRGCVPAQVGKLCFLQWAVEVVQCGCRERSSRRHDQVAA